jgi:uncharacterized protein (UPF0276 family)
MQLTAGVGFKPEYFEEAIASPAEGLWFEVHAENYMVPGGPRLAMLEALRDVRPLSLHGVGLSLAGVEPPDRDHLRQFRTLADRFQPALVSEHLAWSRLGDTCLPDLLPFPRTNAMLGVITRNVDLAQEVLGRRISIENPSLYLPLDEHDWSEADFLAELARRTGCGLLIDVNNVHVSATNLGFDAERYLDSIDGSSVTEIHLAGHSNDPKLGPKLLIDSHDQPVAEPVWELFACLVGRIGPRPTLIERDGNIPPFEELMAERTRAAAFLVQCSEQVDA